jgi:S-DNA-T family DNA segregation ATPase FtsK/SpoIIIE
MAGLHLVYFQQIDSSGIKNFIYSSYEKGQEGIGAGALVSSLVFVMYKLFGIAGGYIFVAVFLVVSLLLLTNLSLKQISDNIYGTIRPKLERQAEKDKKSFAGETIPVNEFTRKPPDELQTLDEAFRQERQEVHRETQIKAAEDKNEDKKDDIPVISKDIQRKALEHGYRIPPTDLLIRPQVNIYEKDRARLAENNARLLEETLNSFGVSAKVTQVSRGPVITRYELHPAPGVKVSRIVSLADDIALNLAAPSVRIEAPIPGKAAVGIEVPNRDISPVYLREVLESEEFIYHPSRIAVALGKDIAGKNIIADIAQMPHLLIAGATGSGKSVCINALILSILYKASPQEVKMIMIDPKMVELNQYNGIPHLLIPVVTNPKKAAGALNWAVQEMTSRYNLVADKGVRDIDDYNMSVETPDERLPQMLVIIDELSDLMMVAPAEVEDAVCRLAQMARAAGIHLIIATQRPSVDVITGLIKANIPSRIAFAVSSQVDSRTILDMGGAEKLLGRGDMLFYPVGANKPIRVQGSFVTAKEVESVVNYIKQQNDSPSYSPDILEEIVTEHEFTEPEHFDELLPEAIETVLDAGQASISMLQRRLRIGYARAARLIDEMEIRGIVSGFEGSKPRNVLITRDEYEKLYKDDIV